MKARAIRSFIDKYTMQDIDRGTEFEVTEERFSELTAGPRGVFVEEIKETPPEDPPKSAAGDDNTTSPTEPPKEQETEATSENNDVPPEGKSNETPADPPIGQNPNEVPKVYKCKKCDFETNNKGELASHYKTVHPKPKE